MIWIAAALLTASVAATYLCVRRGLFAGYALHEFADAPRPSPADRLTMRLAARAVVIAYASAGFAFVAAVLGGWIVGRFL